MEFPIVGVIETNSTEAAVGHAGSLYSRNPVIAAPYVGVLGVAAVVGTLGNLVVITTVTTKHIVSQRHRSEATGNDAGRVFIVNLALSDLIVTAVINPLAIAGSVVKSPAICYFAPGTHAKYCDQLVCLSVRSHISKTTCPNFTESSVRVTYGRGSVLL